MLTLRPRKPRPRETRQLHCPHCSWPIEVSRKAMSGRCPKCSEPMKLEDIVVKQNSSGSLNTMGHVHLTAHSAVNGKLICGQLTVNGTYHGSAQVHGLVQLQSDSHLTGEIHAHSLTIEVGATVNAKTIIGPVGAKGISGGTGGGKAPKPQSAA